jgi:hypothetical protein
MQSSCSLNLAFDHKTSEDLNHRYRLGGGGLTPIKSARFTKSILNCLFALTLILLPNLALMGIRRMKRQ